MSESERRRKYRWDRVLIETDRLFNPQFDDAVVYLTGAQLEMLRNTTQNLRRPETYVSEYAMGYYLTPTVEDYDSILAIVADLEEVLMGNPNTIWGYKDRLFEFPFVTSTGETNTDLYSSSVPAGYVYVVNHWSFVHVGGTTCGVMLMLDDGSQQQRIYTAPALPSGEHVYQSINIPMKEDDRFWLRIIGLPDTTSAYLRIWGYKMVVP